MEALFIGIQQCNAFIYYDNVSHIQSSHIIKSTMVAQDCHRNLMHFEEKFCNCFLFNKIVFVVFLLFFILQNFFKFFFNLKIFIVFFFEPAAQSCQ